MLRPKIIFSKKCLQYGSWNIEGPERVRKAYEILKEKNYEFKIMNAGNNENGPEY